MSTWDGHELIKSEIDGMRMIFLQMLQRLNKIESELKDCSPPKLAEEMQRIKSRFELALKMIPDGPVGVCQFVEGVLPFLFNVLEEDRIRLKSITLHLESIGRVDRRSRGYASKEYSWLNELDIRPDWMERSRKKNNERWRISSENIVNILMTSGNFDEKDVPDKSTITRERNRRLKNNR